jgi:LmbE family N-acetylglucosaminyl deacetylase
MTTAADHHQAWRHLPTGTLADILGTSTAIILAPHPDDESLGCGGLIAACTAAGRPPFVAILTDGAGSHPNSPSYPPHRLRAVRAQETRTALNHLGLPQDRVTFLNQPDTAAPHAGPGFDAIVNDLLSLIRRQESCTTVVAPWRHDPHCDHEAASLIAAAVAKAAAIDHIAYPVWGWTLPPRAPITERPARGFRLDISPFLPAKRAAIGAHQSQYGDLITDDPTGFRLPPNLLAVFETSYETFIQP